LSQVKCRILYVLTGTRLLKEIKKTTKHRSCGHSFRRNFYIPIFYYILLCVSISVFSHDRNSIIVISWNPHEVAGSYIYIQREQYPSAACRRKHIALILLIIHSRIDDYVDEIYIAIIYFVARPCLLVCHCSNDNIIVII